MFIRGFSVHQRCMSLRSGSTAQYVLAVYSVRACIYIHVCSVMSLYREVQ